MTVRKCTCVVSTLVDRVFDSDTHPTETGGVMCSCSKRGELARRVDHPSPFVKVASTGVSAVLLFSS